MKLLRVRRNPKGFVLLSAIFMIIILGGMLGLIMNNVSHSNYLVSQAIYHHRASVALDSYLQIYTHSLKSEKDCQPKQYDLSQISGWENINLKIECFPTQTKQNQYKIQAQAWVLQQAPGVLVTRQKLVALSQKS